MRTKDRITDLLEIEGGWWTAAGISLRLGLNEDSVLRSLVRMRNRGVVESRRVELSYGDGHSWQARQEWRTPR